MVTNFFLSKVNRHINIISAQVVKGVQIMQASPGAKQVVSITKDNLEEVKEIIQKLKESIDKLNLKQEQKEELNSDIQTIEIQLKSSKPKRGVITECLGSIRGILEGVTGNVLASELLPKVISLYALISQSM